MDDAERTLAAATQTLEHRLELIETRRAAALEAIERRLLRIEAVGERTGALMSRAEVETALNGLARRNEADVKAVAVKHEADVKAVSGKLDAFGRTNWPLVVSLVGLLTVLVPGMWALIGLKIEAGVSPLQAAIAVLQIEQRHLGQKAAP